MKKTTFGRNPPKVDAADCSMRSNSEVLNLLMVNELVAPTLPKQRFRSLHGNGDCEQEMPTDARKYLSLRTLSALTLRVIENVVPATYQLVELTN